MTLPSLLRHVGINVPRFVTVDGKVVFDKPESSTTSIRPMAMEPHRFHGGEDPAPTRGDNRSNAWWNVDEEARRRDIAAMKHAFPGFVVNEEDGDLGYAGIIDTGRGRFPLLLLPQIDGSLPRAATYPKIKLGRNEGRYWRKSPHLFTSGSLCIAGAQDWHPGEHTTATAAAWAAHWFAAYTEWWMSGIWPAKGYGIVA